MSTIPLRTEAEAAEFVCPFRTSFAHTIEPPACMGSKCMLWVPAPRHTTTDPLKLKDERGSCGAAKT